MNKTVLRYPTGAGGKWFLHLANLLEHYEEYENYDFDNIVNFHIASQETSKIALDHNESCCSSDELLGGPETFNFYLNFWWKKRVFDNFENFNDLLDYKKIEVLSNDARWRMYSQEYKNSYLDNITIPFKWIWQNPQSLLAKFEEILKIQTNSKQQAIFYKHLKIYKKTNVDPMNHFDNYYSIPWLGWCLAILNEHEIYLDFQFNNSRQLPIVANYFVAHRDLFIEETEKRMLKIQ